MTAAPSDRFRDGPSVVAVGGGHGQAASLRAIKRYAGNVTAIVSVADDGGSSGRLRELLGIPAPGDVRTCLGALLPDGSAIAKALEHRFAVGELDGHALGNLIITALAEAEGDFVAGVAEACRVLGTVGQVIPATSGAVELVASTRAGQVRGQVAVKEGGGIDRLEVVAVGGPEALEPPPAALKAILESDQIVIGPGSLYTSVLAACVVPAVREAIEEAGRRGAQRVYVANLREQHPETTGYDIAAHVQALTDHGVEPDVVLADTTFLGLGSLPKARVAALAKPHGLSHDPSLLARELSGLLGSG